MRHRRSLIPVALAGIAASALLAAGCGGGGSAGVANVTTSTSHTTTEPQNGSVAFARCLRAHGLPNWPDPESSGAFDKAKLRQLGYTPARVRAVEDGPCKHVQPTSPEPQQTAQQQRTLRADGLSFARCMRSHGVARFPDPTAQGRLTIAMVQAQGIDVHSPRVLQAVQTCLPASHGALTPAKIREALQQAGG